MSRRDWLHHIAVRGFLILILFASASFAQEPSEPNASANQQQSTTEREKSDETRAAPADQETRSQNEIARKAGVAESKKPDSKIYRSPCGNTEDHDQADLCEQQRMSAAAERAADYAWLQLIVGGFGLALVVVSLVFAGIAAFAARDAAIAARDQARLTAETAERQLRAYVFVTQADIFNVAPGQRPNVRVRMQNSGQTPAYNLSATLSIGYGIHPIPSGARFPDTPNAPALSRKDVGPSAALLRKSSKAVP
jgi:hypothetical protein